MPDLVRRTAFLLASLVLGVALTAQQSPQAPAAPAPQPPAAGTAPQGPPPGGAGPGGRQGGRGFRGGTPIQAGEECPQGMTEVRPRICQAPGLPPPSIVDYRPESTLVTAEHKVPKAKFPAIDFHGHPQGAFGSPEGLASLVGALDSLNVRLMVSADNMSGERLQRTLETIRGTQSKDRVRVLAGIDFRGVGPGWSEKAIKQLRGGHRGRGGRRRGDCEGPRAVDHEGGWDPAGDRRSRARSRLGGVRPPPRCRSSSTPPTRRSSSSRSTSRTSGGWNCRSSPTAATRRTGSRSSRS